MNDFATLCGLPRTARIAGRTYRLWPLTLGDLGRFQCWLDEAAVAPEAVRLAADILPQGPADYLRRLPRARTRVLFGSEAADSLASSMLGLTELLYLAIRRGRRRFRRADAADLYWHLDDDATQILRWCVRGETTSGDGDGDDVRPEPDRGIDVWRLLWTLTNDPYRFTPGQVARMTMTQVRCTLSDGKPPNPTAFKDAASLSRYREQRAADPWHQ